MKLGVNMFGLKKYYTYRIILKSGADFYVKCQNLEIKYNPTDTHLTSYEFEGIHKRSQNPFHVNILDVSTIIKIP